jgi:hypothetical protein
MDPLAVDIREAGRLLSLSPRTIRIQYPLFVLEKDDCSMLIVEKPEQLFTRLEEIDIQNDEYFFWDASGRGVHLRVAEGKVVVIENCEATKDLSEAFVAYCQSLGLNVEFANQPAETWKRIQAAERLLPRKKSLFARLFSLKSR